MPKHKITKAEIQAYVTSPNYRFDFRDVIRRDSAGKEYSVEQCQLKLARIVASYSVDDGKKVPVNRAMTRLILDADV